MYNPCVVEIPGEYKYKMWFFGWAASKINEGWPGADAIFHARSKDLIHWEVYSENNSWDKSMDPTKWVPVIHASEKWYEAWHVGDPSVVFKDGLFYMAYSSTSNHFSAREGYPATMVQCIMGASSADGIHWKKSPQPILIAPGDTPDPKPSPNRIGDFHRPCLKWSGAQWQLWFDYWVPGKGVSMGCAEGKAIMDPFHIIHQLEEPLMANWPNPEVVFDGQLYYSFSDAGGYPIKPGESIWKSRQLKQAVSKDGFNWKVLDFIAPDDDTDACHVPQALVTKIDGQSWLYLFYATQIGYAKNDGKYHYQYNRIRSMRRKLNF